MLSQVSLVGEISLTIRLALQRSSYFSFSVFNKCHSVVNCVLAVKGTWSN